MKRIGILGHGFISWGGGLDFLRLIIGALFEQYPPGQNKYYLLLPINDPDLPRYPQPTLLSKTIKALTGRDVPSRRAPPEHLPLAALKDALREFWPQLEALSIDHRDKRLAQAYEGLQLDVVLPSIAPLQVPDDMHWVGYVYDLQHKYFPQFFAQEELLRRDAHFPAMLGKARSLIVNAQAVVDDIDRFFAPYSGKVMALPFCASPNAEWFTVEDARPRYGLARPYFIVCNQFWMHKDHRTAFLAFAELAKSRPDIDLICTGHTTDYRNPQHLASLEAIIAEHSLKDRVHILGAIPKLDQISLLQHAVALIQPTLFEGGPGGGAVFDATSLGIRSIVSDISVNQELHESTVTFFRAGDAAALAEAMAATLDAPPRRRPPEAELRALATQRKQRCGQTLAEAMRLAGMP